MNRRLKNDTKKGNQEMKLARSLCLVILAIALAVPLIGCSEPESLTDEKVFVFATGHDTGSLDPAAGASNSQYAVLYDLYDRLVTIRGESTDVQPMLAESWEVNDDATEYTFYLRKDAKFHDGTPVNAASVKFSFDRILKTGKLGASMFKPYIDPNEIETPDEWTVTFNLKQAFPGFLPALGSGCALIHNPAVMQHEQDGDLGAAWAATNDCGSGPFILESATLGEQVVFKRNDDYWGQKPAFEKVIIQVVPEASTQRAMLEKGEVDMIDGRGLNWETLEQLAKTEGISVVDRETFDILYMIFNTEKAPFDDLKVRQAVASALDYDGIIEGIYLNHAVRLNCATPKGLFGHDESLPMPERDVERANELMVEAGHPDGFDVEFSIGQDAAWQKLAVKIQADLDEIGVRINIRQYAWSAYYEKLSAGDFNMALCGWTPDYADPQYNIWYFYYSENAGPGYNWAFYRDPEMDEMIMTAGSISDQAERQRLYTDLQARANADLPYLWLAQMKNGQPMRTWVKGYVMNPMNNWYVPFSQMSKTAE